MKILWLSPTPTHPESAGNRAHIKAMGKQMMDAGHEVTFCFYGQEASSVSDRKEMAEFWSDFIYIPHRHHYRTKSLEKYWAIDDWFNKDLEAISKVLAEQGGYDAIYCEYIFFSKSLTYFGDDVFKILSCHDRMSGRAELLQKNNIQPDFFYTTKSEEKKALDRADVILGIQSEEVEYFKSLTNKHVIEVCYPVERKELPKKIINNKLTIGYLGSNNSLNRKSIEILLNSLESIQPDINFYFAGSICKVIKASKNIKCFGYVENEADFYASVDIVINPMVDGTGLKIKSLSSLSHGMPYVATSPASAGILTQHKEHNYKTIEELVNYIVGISKSTSRSAIIKDLKSKSNEVFNNYNGRVNKQINNLLNSLVNFKNSEVISESETENIITNKRVLMVTDVPFWESGFGSHSRIESLVRGIASENHLDVFYFGSMWPDRRDSINGLQLGADVISYKDYEQLSDHTHIKDEFKKNSSISHKRHQTFSKSLKFFLQLADKYDVIVFEYIWLAYLVENIPYKAFTILDSHDIMSVREYKFKKNGILPSVSISMKDELDIMDNFDSVVAIQKEEYDILYRNLKAAIPICAPHVVNIKACESSPKTFNNKVLNLTFVGANSEANFHGIDWFIKYVWPNLTVKNCILNIVGNVCSRFNDDYDERILFHGLVEDINKIYEVTDIALNPMFFGGGLKIKSVESMAYGVPLVCTFEAAVGISNPQDSGIIICNCESEFTEAIIKLKEDVHLRKKMSADALNAIEKQFSSKACYKDLLASIRGV